MQIEFSPKAQKQFVEYRNAGDKKSLGKIFDIIQNITQTPFSGIGKPEPLKHTLAGMWSRQINKKDRLVYQIDDEVLMIISIKGHYDDK